ncbi:hypothetical protein [Bacillus sp. 1P06AnD]|uniref:hypothetical protein n=1 Tax=Bacillus sp. 1P06AnD TaxID=3132208 RepID=UPI0039A371DF
MDPSKEIDKLFKEMRHIERSQDARKQSLMNIQNKLSKKKRHLAPIFISISLIALSFFILFLLTDQFSHFDTNNAVRHVKTNPEVIRTVIEKEFTAPDNKYIQLFNEVGNKELKNPNTMAEKEREALQRYAEEKYKPFFSEGGFMRFLNSTPAFFYQRGDIDYKLTVKNIEISQDNKLPTLYSFTFIVDLKETNGDVTSFEFHGEATCLEKGKLDSIMFTDGMNGLSSQLLDMENDKRKESK